MKLHLQRPDIRHVITAHEAGAIHVNGVAYPHSLVVLPDELIAPWHAAWHTLTTADFDLIAVRAPEVLLLGTGARQRFPAAALYRTLIAARIGVEVMDTAAACRTYNILAAEGRRVAAALLLEVALRPG